MIQRVCLSLKKSLGKTILLLVIMFVVANLVISGLAIQSASKKSMKQIRESLGSDVTLSVNMSNMMKNREKGQALEQVLSPITEDMADQLKELEYVEGYNYTVSASVNSESIVPISTTEQTIIMQFPQSTDRGGMTVGDFILSGNITMAYEENFTNNSYELIEGRLLDEQDKDTHYVVISDSLATDNDLIVGSKFNVNNTDGTVSKELEVVGIYQVNSSNEMGFNQQNPMNTLYVPIEVAKEISETENLTSATYYLNDPENIETFKELANQTSIDWEVYTLDANDMAYQQSASALSNMESFATIFVLVVIIAGGSILCLILMLTIKNRTYEIGVFVSLGETKLNIIMQQFLEIAVVGVIAFTLSLGSGKLIANVMSNMLEQNASSSSTVMMQMPGKTNKENIPSNMFKSPNNVELDVSLTMEDSLKLASITTMICAVSTLLPALYILRLSPREILVRKEG